MDQHSFERPASLLLLASALGLTLALDATPADAAPGFRDRAAAAAQARPRGDYTRRTTRRRTEHGRVRTDRWTRAEGRSVERRAEVANDRAAGTRIRDVDWIGPQGGTAGRETVTQRTGQGYTRSTTATGREGRTATRETEVVRDRRAGTRDRSVVTTGPNGRTRTLDDTVARTEDGYTRSTTVTGPEGATGTRDVTASYDPETGTLTRDVAVDRPDS